MSLHRPARSGGDFSDYFFCLNFNSEFHYLAFGFYYSTFKS